MSVFLGIGLGPIQSGIFISGASKGGFSRIVIADVDRNLVEHIRSSGSIKINIAKIDDIIEEEFAGIEIYNPQDPDDLQKLVEAASVASEISTALPSVNHYQHIAPWLIKGFSLSPERRRFIYTAENNNRAAEILKDAIGCDYANTFFLNTVIGKMCKVFRAVEHPELCAISENAENGHLVEEFSNIYISSPPGIEQRKCLGLFPKNELLPFEEAKLYGHNAVHFLLGWKAAEAGLNYMSELSSCPELIDYGRKAFIEEAGAALCRKWHDCDPLFAPQGFAGYSEDLLIRMTNIFLSDTVSRVIRDLPRKLAYEDRMIGTIHLCLEQKVIPERFIATAGSIFQSDMAIYERTA